MQWISKVLCCGLQEKDETLFPQSDDATLDPDAMDL
jgi:hypothetical protein